MASATNSSSLADPPAALVALRWSRHQLMALASHCQASSGPVRPPSVTQHKAYTVSTPFCSFGSADRSPLFHCEKFGIVNGHFFCSSERTNVMKKRFLLVMLIVPWMISTMRLGLALILKSKFSDEQIIQDKIRRQLDLFDRGHKYFKIEIDKSFPQFIINNKIFYQKWIL